MHSRTVNIESPCHESWEAMAGEGARRFCGVCQKDVHDLSAMAHDEADRLLRERGGSGLCVRYTAEADGTLRFRDLVPRASLTRKLVRTALAAAALAACAPHGEGPVRGLGEALIESMRASTVPTADGGCDYTTGPFTTFHLPAGHMLCTGEGAVPSEPPPMMMGGIGPGNEEPPPDEPVLDEPALAEPVRAEMGKMMAAPEPAPELVPCDPKVEAPVTAPKQQKRMGKPMLRPGH